MGFVRVMGAAVWVMMALVGCAGDVVGGPGVDSAAQGDSACAPDDKSCGQPTPGPCAVVDIGDGSTCQPWADLKTEATLTCAEGGGGLTDFRNGDGDGCVEGEVTAATYTCCQPATE